MNRQQRRAASSIHKKEVKSALIRNDYGAWEDITQECRDKLQREGKKDFMRIKKYLKNNIYSAQVIEHEKGYLLGIRRHDQSTDIPWAHKQKIKNEILGAENQAIEVYPPESQLIDDANMYWLWSFNYQLLIFDLKNVLLGVYG